LDVLKFLVIICHSLHSDINVLRLILIFLVLQE